MKYNDQAKIVLFIMICVQLLTRTNSILYSSVRIRDRNFPTVNQYPDQHLHYTHRRPMRLYCRVGLYLTILKNGTVSSTIDKDSPDAIIEMQSYGVRYKRMRKPNSNYLAIDKHGRIRTRVKPRKDTMFKEFHAGDYIWYQNNATNFILALRKNMKPKHNVTGMHKRSKKTQFLMLRASYTYPTDN